MSRNGLGYKESRGGKGPGREPGLGHIQVPLGPGAVLCEVRPASTGGQITVHPCELCVFSRLWSKMTGTFQINCFMFSSRNIVPEINLWAFIGKQSCNSAGFSSSL